MIPFITRTVKISPYTKFIKENSFNNKNRINVKSANKNDKTLFAELKAQTKESMVAGQIHHISKFLDDNVFKPLEKEFNNKNGDIMLKFIQTNTETACTSSDELTNRLSNQFDNQLPFTTIDQTALNIKAKAAEIFKNNAKHKCVVIAHITITAHEQWMDHLSNAPSFEQHHNEVLSFIFTDPQEAFTIYWEPNGHFMKTNHEQCMF